MPPALTTYPPDRTSDTPASDFRSLVLVELRHQLCRGLFDLGFAAARLRAERGSVLSALASLRALGFCRFDVDAGWVLQTTEVA